MPVQISTTVDDLTCSKTDTNEVPQAVVSTSPNQGAIPGVLMEAQMAPADEGLSRIEVESTGRSTRKRTAYVLKDLQTCLCGEVVLDNNNGTIECRYTKTGCETGRVSLIFSEILH